MSPKQLIRYILLLLCYLCLASFSLISILYIFFDSTTLGWLIAMFYPSVAPMLFILVLTCGFIIIRFSFMQKRREMFAITLVCGFIFIGSIIPYMVIPLTFVDAENQMLNVYGESYQNLGTSSMRPVPYSLYDDIYGISIDESKYFVEYDIPYLNNGEDIFLFDWYCPVGEGPFPVIISIHGGAWVIGNKGYANIPLFSHYFASKGYVVFDIQYGLFDISSVSNEGFSTFSSFASIGGGLLPNYNRSYNIEDQIENIGVFTKVLDLNSSKYQADMNNVFVLGRSAGGNMASLVTLGYNHPLFAGNFSSNMNIKGGIWLYPATNITRDHSGSFDPFVEGSLTIEEQYDKLFAATLVESSTNIPPIIILHGSKDGLAEYETQGLSFYRKAISLGVKCILITIQWAGHGFDYDFNGFGGQISTFYIERFISLEISGS